MEHAPSWDHFERSQWQSSTRYVDHRDEQHPSWSNTARLELEDTHAWHADHIDDPFFCGR
jgi:hypothetical protein